MTGRAKTWTPELMRKLYVIDQETSCWLWVGGCYSNGYGRKRYKGKTISASAFSLIVNKGINPGSEWTAHTCQNKKLCVNPEHLVVGNPLKKLTDEQVKYVKVSQASGVDIAKELGVSSSLISLIRNNKTRTEA